METLTAQCRPKKIIDSYRETDSERNRETDAERDHIPPFVHDAILRVERWGCTDMWDRETVLMLAATYGHEQGAEWLAMRRHLYFIALRQAHESVQEPASHVRAAVR